MSLQKRLRDVTEDQRGTNCVSVYQGAYENVHAKIGWETVAIHTTDAALLCFYELYKQCMRCKWQGLPAPHLIIYEASDRRQGLILNAALTLQQEGWLQLWIMSATMLAAMDYVRDHARPDF